MWASQFGNNSFDASHFVSLRKQTPLGGAQSAGCACSLSGRQLNQEAPEEAAGSPNGVPLFSTSSGRPKRLTSSAGGAETSILIKH